MHNVTYKNEKSIKRIFKQPFKWAVLTVSNGTGYHKIAIKKNLFKKTYTVSYVLNGKLYTDKKEILLDELAYKNITIAGLGNLHIEDISVSLTNPSKIIENEEKVYSKIDSKARREEQTKKEKEIQQLRQQHELLEKEKQDKQYVQQSYVSDCIYKWDKEVIWSEVSSDTCSSGFYETNRYIKGEGYKVDYRFDNSAVSYKKCYDLSFVIKNLVEYSKKIGYDGFDNNRLMDTLSIVNTYVDALFIEKVVRKCVFHGFLAQELYMRTMGLCKYIRENRINISDETYHYSCATTLSNGGLYSENEVIDDFVNELIKSASDYIRRVTGIDYSANFKNELEFMPLALIR